MCGLYVEAAKALNELGIRARGGFFSGADDYAQGLIDLTCGKLLHVQLLRNVDGTTFFQVECLHLQPASNYTLPACKQI